MTAETLTDQIMVAIATDAGNSREVVLGLVEKELGSLLRDKARLEWLDEQKSGFIDYLRALVL